jgi:hypothetical protein
MANQAPVNGREASYHMREIETWWYTCRKVTWRMFPFTIMMICAMQDDSEAWKWWSAQEVLQCTTRGSVQGRAAGPSPTKPPRGLTRWDNPQNKQDSPQKRSIQTLAASDMRGFSLVR